MHDPEAIGALNAMIADAANLEPRRETVTVDGRDVPYVTVQPEESVWVRCTPEEYASRQGDGDSPDRLPLGNGYFARIVSVDLDWGIAYVKAEIEEA